jgi:hypothetical protein
MNPALSAKPAAIIITKTSPNGGNLVKLPTIFDRIQSSPFRFNKLIISIFSLLPGATADTPAKTPESAITSSQKNKNIQNMWGNLFPTRSIHPTNLDKMPFSLLAKTNSSLRYLKRHLKFESHLGIIHGFVSFMNHVWGLTYMKLKFIISKLLNFGLEGL